MSDYCNMIKKKAEKNHQNLNKNIDEIVIQL
jgi:hypothetical protein